ncbi:phosphoenolpyruvate synthase regulatory protein [Psychrilyobacter piezotolerans]|uniref:Phosphoenolpyruvate synthase regulatory protein n=1 Tax=Psychrilyobacter piezotolerans TaxID=2293438 RepID=A0ABX9KF28_9FUSO|nr:kinase/pyrophosphorylase [Psychrilyobacter piezotolerans]RDE59381.1 phosphoenolpyruvate synthase regulatory protein [Psychrilyobacter sp. S5]REI39884.1 phosphoenolpyruvate synthase regulatory protein [Psychrilyobacter piezotolerans]
MITGGISIIDIYFIKDDAIVDSEVILKVIKDELNREDFKLIQITLKEFKSLDVLNSQNLVFYSLKDKKRLRKLESFCMEKDIVHFDTFKILKYGFKKLFEKSKANSFKKMDEKYFKRIEAMEFAVKYDDGKISRGILEADLLIVGLSRTSKTPLSIYLANKSGLKIINIPLVPEVPIPKEVFQATQVIGLTISIDKLNKIREQRLKTMKAEERASSYASFGRILEELDYSDKIMKKLQCPVIDVSEKAIEETAEIILKLIKA